MPSLAINAWEDEWDAAEVQEGGYVESAQVPEGNYKAALLKFGTHDTKDAVAVAEFKFQVTDGASKNAILLLPIFLQSDANVKYLKGIAAKMGISCKLSELEERINELCTGTVKPLFELKVEYKEYNGKSRQNVYVQKQLASEPFSTKRPTGTSPKSGKSDPAWEAANLDDNNPLPF